MQQRGLATAAGAHHRNQLARVHAEIGMIESGHGSLAFAVHFGQVLYMQQRLYDRLPDL
jgi:hypothetical protein